MTVAAATALVCPGDTFIIDPSILGSRDHLWVVLFVRIPDYAYVEYASIVNVTSLTRFADRTCLLGPSDIDRHPFVTHDSYVYYAAMREIEVAELLLVVVAKQHDPTCDALLTRMRNGVHLSPRTARGFKSYMPR